MTIHRGAWLGLSALVLLGGCGGGEDTPATAASTVVSTSTTAAPMTVPGVTGETEVDQLIDDIAEGFSRFRGGSDDDLETMLLGWAYASGTYQRVADELRTRPPADVPEHVAEALAAALTEAGEGFMAAAQCGAEALETGAGPELCEEVFSDATTANATVAVRLEPVIGYGSRSYSEVVDLFS